MYIRLGTYRIQIFSHQTYLLKMSNTKVHETIDIGAAPNPNAKWEVVPLRFHRFERLDSTKDKLIKSPEFNCYGNRWCVWIYPGGSGDSAAKDGFVSLFLCNVSRKNIKVDFGFSVKTSTGILMGAHKHSLDVKIVNNWGYTDFVKRERVLGHLVEGALLINVRIRRHDYIPPSVPFVAENPYTRMILKMFMNEKSADILINVGGQKGKSNARKKVKTSPTTFYAHKLILQQCSETFAELCGIEGSITIDDVKPETFKHMLYYIYGGKISEEDLKEHARDIIDAADKYGIITLKLEAEVAYVKDTTIDFSNVMDLLLYADSKNCALLKEAVIDFIVENKDDMLQKVVLKDVPGGLFAELLAAMSRKEKRAGSSEGNSSFMSIHELRRKAHEKGINIDGSREMLIASLKEDD